MPELLSLPTLIAMATVLLAGIVRGFAGFGSAMKRLSGRSTGGQPQRAARIA